MHEPVTRVKYGGAALPADSDTEVLFNSTLNGVHAKRWLHSAGCRRFSYAIDHDQDGTVKGYWSTDQGTTWVEFYSTAHALADSPAEGDVFIEPYDDVKFEWDNGGTTQTTFDPNLILSPDRSPSS